MSTPALAPIPRILWLQSLAGFRALWRIPAFSVTGLALPVMFFGFFGLPNVHRNLGGVDAGLYILGSLAAYSVSQMMVFNFGITVANERAAKQDLLTRATPLPAWVYLLSKVFVAAAFALLALLILIGFAEVAGGVRMPLGTFLNLVLRLLLGSICFIALGFAIGYAFSASAAPAVTNLVYLPLAFASGIFIPLSQMPDFIQKVAPWLPTYHYGQLAWSLVGARDAESPARAALALGIWTVVFLTIALRTIRIEEERKFG